MGWSLLVETAAVQIHSRLAGRLKLRIPSTTFGSVFTGNVNGQSRNRLRFSAQKHHVFSRLRIRRPSRTWSATKRPGTSSTSALSPILLSHTGDAPRSASTTWRISSSPIPPSSPIDESAKPGRCPARRPGKTDHWQWRHQLMVTDQYPRSSIASPCPFPLSANILRSCATSATPNSIPSRPSGVTPALAGLSPLGPPAESARGADHQSRQPDRPVSSAR